MEHLGLMTVEQIARAGKLNLALSFFVDHLRFYGLVYKTDIFGDRVNRWTPLSEATKDGITWTIHQVGTSIFLLTTLQFGHISPLKSSPLSDL